ncbi:MULTISPECIES: hypothetical protein [Kitasatospora]|uniref:Uncharacterized protein n=1 Tax=Kitasatospora griseola TaxID=2064 RepID=A0A0D0P241_KITGR|nr:MULTISPECIES: hypothetical protein [Kitasatospora]KIQ65651.1 hypothetical protein TR51_17765 [Kitasatospora griseola]PJN29244.1 hypothetical protein CG736_01390 [Kitasatospora sp. CB02891]GGQ78923.1 hypothetical protein GCM10010195_38350 [Kitasatospora griseola]
MIYGHSVAPALWMILTPLGVLLFGVGLASTIRIRPGTDRPRDHLLGPLLIATGILVTGFGLWLL